MEFYDSRYFSINKTMLKGMGLWIYQSRLKKFLIRAVFATLISISFVPQIISLMKYLKTDADKVIQSIATILYILGISLKLVAYVFTDKKIKIVYDNIIQNWKMIEDEDEKKTLIEYSEIGRLLTIGYISYMFLALILFITLPLLPILVDVILPINGSRQKIFILDGEYIMDKYENYGKVYIFESSTCVLTVFIFCTIDSTYTVCVQQCIGLIAIIKLRLKRSTKHVKQVKLNDNDKDVAYDLIVHSAELHKKVINFANILESSYSVSFLVVMGANVLILSVGSVIIIMNLDRPMELLRYVMIFIGLMIHMFYVSWPGQQMIDNTGGILLDAYNNEWYECSLETQKLLQIMMLRSVEPCQLTAGGVYVMNIANCGSLAKTSISYITVFASFR